MIPIFVNDKPIVLTTKVCKETDFKNYLLDTVNITNVIKTLNETSLKSVRLIGNNKNDLLKQFLKKLPNVIAGGGKVRNADKNILFIYRNRKWDLPKGKVENGETLAKTAIREVEEETGVTGLTITKPLETTYHIFRRNGDYKIKITYWFEMKTMFDGEMYPQENEGITKVKWLDSKQISIALENSYANIKLLF